MKVLISLRVKANVIMVAYKVCNLTAHYSSILFPIILPLSHSVAAKLASLPFLKCILGFSASETLHVWSLYLESFLQDNHLSNLSNLCLDPFFPTWSTQIQLFQIASLFSSFTISLILLSINKETQFTGKKIHYFNI